MSRYPLNISLKMFRFPRTRGDEPDVLSTGQSVGSFSPHARG